MTDTSGTYDSALEPHFYLGNWKVDARSNRLTRDETEIKLESRVMAVLACLVQRAGEVVTREELERAVWGNTVVGYEALTSSIAKLRKVLDDDPKAPRYIETISKKGYRLIAPVSTEAPAGGAVGPRGTRAAEPGDHGRRRRLGWAAGLGVVLAVLAATLLLLNINDDTTAPALPGDRPSIVVLPFANLGKDPGQDYFSDGMTADITTALSKMSGLFVISPMSANAYGGRPADIGKIARSLGVRYVLEGSVRRTGKRLRVNVNLIDATRNFYLWSEKYDRELRQVFDVQDDVTKKIVEALSVRLTEEERRRTARKYTTSLAAYDDFLQGQARYIRHTAEDNQLARELYQRALLRDESFARAYSAMALTYVAEQRYGWGGSSHYLLDKALALAKKGVALDSGLPQAHWVLGYVHVFRREYDKAARAASRALALNPNYADSYLTLAVCRIHSGSPEQALRLVRKAMLLNPQYPAAYASVLGQAHFFMEQYDQAVPALRDAIYRNENLLTAHLFLIVALSKLDQLEEARWAAATLKSMAPDLNSKTFSPMLPARDARTLADMQRHLERAGL